ncbi:MAG: peroxiredoxin [Saprospiraceae bacterium]|jgi:peroxiredoxin
MEILQKTLKTSMILLSMSFLYTIQAQEIGDFTLDNLDNEQVSLSEIQGAKLTVIDFWATWCKPCTKAMPKLNDIYNQYKDNGLTMIGISCDGPRSISRVPAVANNLNIDYHILKDIDCEIMNTYQYQAFPTLIILNAENEVVYVHEGFSSGDEKDIKAAIEAHLE